MKPQGLRIGNYIISSGELRQEHTVTGMNEEFVYFGPNYSSYYKNIKPIPLTKIWIEKFGFENDKDYKHLWTAKPGFCVAMNDISVHYCPQQRSWITEGEEIKYVHQLQNLYFALTNKELSIPYNL